MPVHVIWKGAYLNWSLLFVWIRGRAHLRSTFICLFQSVKATGLCGKWKEVSRRHHHQVYCKGRQGWVFVCFFRGQTNFSVEHQLQFYFYGEGEWNYDGNLVGAGDDGALCTCAFSR